MNARLDPVRFDSGRFEPARVDAAAATMARLPVQDLPIHDATTLTRGGAQAHIVLNGQVYSLRITRAGKLILTK